MIHVLRLIIFNLFILSHFFIEFGKFLDILHKYHDIELNNSFFVNKFNNHNIENLKI